MIVSITSVLVTALGGSWDAKTGHIPNWLTFPFLLGGLAFHLVVSGWRGLATAVLGVLLCGLVPWFLFRQQAMGGGDVKLLAGVGSWMGYGPGLEVQLLACFLTSLYAITRLLWRGELWKMLRNTFWLVANSFLPSARKRTIQRTEMTTVRFGVPIFLATLAVTAWSHMRLSWLGL